MQLRGHHRWLAGIIGLAAVAAPVALTQLGGSAASAAAGPDTVQYVQTTGSGGTYLQYVPGDGSTPTTQSVTSGGGCATPSPSGPPILAFSAQYYNQTLGGVPYTGQPVAAVVGAYKARTGVCAVPQDWSIEQNESLVFSIGPNPLIAGRLFTQASIQLQRQDKSSSPSVQATLIERMGTTVEGTQNVSIPGSAGAQVTATTGPVGTGFDSVEIRMSSPSTGSISVVGPTSTFTLGSPGLSLTKSHVLSGTASPNYSSAGQVVTYTVTATNSGFTSLSNVSVTDSPNPDGGLSCTPSASSLAIGASVVCTGTHTITQADLDRGSLSDTATVSGTSPQGRAVSATASDIVLAAQNPALTLTKADNLHTYTTPGQVVTYTITATNSGNVTLSNVSVTDAPALDGFTCPTPAASLAPGAALSCTGTHTITLADFSGNGSYADTATANAAGPQNQLVSATAGDTVSAQVSQLCPGQTIDATSSGTATAGDVTGQVTLDPSAPSCKAYTLFQASTTDLATSPDDGKSIIFDSQSVTGAQVTASFDWGLVAQCRPDSSGLPAVPVCPVTRISFDNGATYQPQTYCAAGAPPPASPSWCTTSKTFADVVVAGTTYTHITETWRGTGDPRVGK